MINRIVSCLLALVSFAAFVDSLLLNSSQRRIVPQRHITSAMLIILGTLVVLAAPDNSAQSDDKTPDDRSPFVVSTKRTNDRVTVMVDKDHVVIVIRSPVGISRATIERREERWPEKMIVRFHLKGLENFKITAGKIQLEGALSNHQPQSRLWKAGREDQLLTSESLLWIVTTLKDKNGTAIKSISMDDDYIEMVLPPKLFEDNPKSFTLDWIDFYRN